MDQPEFQAVGGQLHRVVYQAVDQNSVEAEVQAQLDNAQNQLNQATQTREQAEQVYANAEAAAEAAGAELEAAKQLEGEAESVAQKSLTSHDAFTRAKQLAAEQLEQGNAEEVDSSMDSSEESAESETTDISNRINVAA